VPQLRLLILAPQKFIRARGLHASRGGEGIWHRVQWDAVYHNTGLGSIRQAISRL